jgi:hypothetical protein
MTRSPLAAPLAHYLTDSAKASALSGVSRPFNPYIRSGELQTSIVSPGSGQNPQLLAGSSRL